MASYDVIAISVLLGLLVMLAPRTDSSGPLLRQEASPLARVLRELARFLAGDGSICGSFADADPDRRCE